jgi:hypothetical protein
LARCGKQIFGKSGTSGSGLGVSSGGWEGFVVTDSIQQNYITIDSYREALATALGGKVDNGNINVDGHIIMISDAKLLSGKFIPYSENFDINEFNKLSIDNQNKIKNTLKKSSNTLLGKVQSDYEKYKVAYAIAEKLNFDMPPFEPPRDKIHGGYGMTKVISQYNTFEKSIVKLGLGILTIVYSNKVEKESTKKKTASEVKEINAQYKFEVDAIKLKYKYNTKASVSDNLEKMDIFPDPGWFKEDVYFEGNKKFFTDALNDAINR